MIQFTYYDQCLLHHQKHISKVVYFRLHVLIIQLQKSSCYGQWKIRDTVEEMSVSKQCNASENVGMASLTTHCCICLAQLFSFLLSVSLDFSPHHVMLELCH